jgi:predicted transcriptional regulator
MLPCKEVHWKILPAVSRELALCLEEAGVGRARIARELGTTPAAVSQYISGKRGGAAISPVAKKACCALARRMASGSVKGSLNVEIARIIAIAKKSGLGDSDPCVVCAGGKG